MKMIVSPTDSVLAGEKFEILLKADWPEKSLRYVILERSQHHKIRKNLINFLVGYLGRTSNKLPRTNAQFYGVEINENLPEGLYVLSVFRKWYSLRPCDTREFVVRSSTAQEWHDRLKGYLSPSKRAEKVGPGLVPLHLVEPVRYLDVHEVSSRPPVLNVILPRLAMASVSGGPNTAFNIGYRLAAQGVCVRFLSLNDPADQDISELHDHIRRISGVGKRLDNVEFFDVHSANGRLEISNADMFMATAWWTAYTIKELYAKIPKRKFIYLIQEYEPGLHAQSMHYLMALNTYSLDFVPVINHSLVFQFLKEGRIGKFADPDFASGALVFDPAVDRERFSVLEKAKRKPGPRRLLFYARPAIASRNMFELGLLALQLASFQGVFDSEKWDIVAIGDKFTDIPLGNNFVLKSLDQYAVNWADEIRSADVLLSLIASPHPSYPPLEMVACGGIVVTNTFACKTKDKLAGISENIIAAEPTIEDLAEAISVAVRRAAENDVRKDTLRAPKTWDESLAGVIPALLRSWQASLQQSRESS